MGGVEHLPYLALVTIVDRIPAALDRRNLCLTCHALREHTLPSLYRIITLPTRKLTKTLPLSLHAQSQGLAYTRTLVVQDSFEGEYRQEWHGKVLLQTLRNIPVDSLRWLALDTISHVPVEMLLFVRSRQRNLENFQLHHSCFFSPINTLPEHSDLKNVTSFQFFLETEEDGRRACRVIQNATTVLSLDICISGDTNIRGDYFGKRCLTLMEALFDYYHLADLEIKTKLRKLRLKQVNLSYAGKILLEMLDFRYMTDLILDGCKDCREFLEELSQRDHDLKAFSDERGLEFCGGFERSEFIVSSATSLVHVTLSSAFGPSDSLPCSLPLFLKHGTTLRSLILDDSGYSMCTFGVPGRSLSAFRELSLCCPRLEFLAITMPALGEEGLCDHEDLIKCLTNLHALVILRIITQSQYRGMDLCQHAEEHTEEAGPKTMIHAGAQKFANRLFRDLSLHCSDLINIVIDVRKFGEDCTNGRPRQYAYLRRTQRDKRGETFTFGVPEELRSIKTYIGPHCSTL